jgi:hypothetical protein
VTLVNAETGEIVAECTAEEARALTDRIKVGVEACWQLIAEAYQSRAWAALGYSSWDDYTTREFGTSRLRLPREDRQDVVASLRDAGLSDRAIEAATGVSRRTHTRHKLVVTMPPPATVLPAEQFDDLAASLDDPPVVLPQLAEAAAAVAAEPAFARVTGTDGKTYKVGPGPQRKRSPLPDLARSAGWDLRKVVERIERLVADDRFAANEGQVASALRGHLSYTVEVFQDLLDRLDH